MSKERTILQVGIDVGSTTTKIAALDVKSRRVIYSDYQRHHADQVKSVSDALWKLYGRFPDAQFHLALTGSGAKRLGDALGVPYVQEVVANSIALRSKYEDVGTAIELGGQDAKIIFFRKNADSGQLEVADMRMNGSCAGGTGAFIDEVAAILHVSIEEFDALAAKGDCVYDVSGRCGVYAKTDIQPLLNQGVSKENLALSAFHAIAKQTIGGLAQGLEIKKPVAFEGGPLTFNPTLIRVFAQRLELAPEDILVPERPELMMAYGAALSLETLYAGQDTQIRPERIMDGLQHVKEAAGEGEKGRPFFESQEERRAFEEKHALPRVLSFWDTMPFWSTFFRALGFEVKLSRPSTRKMYESGLSAVTSDTVCFPAKLVHGHIRDLVKQGVDRIFMPSGTTVPSENTQKTSESMCAVVKGYPLIIRNSDDPERQWGVPFDAPLFHWYTDEDRLGQLTKYMEDTFQIPAQETRAAVKAADRAQWIFRHKLVKAGEQVLRQAEEQGTYAVVLAARPYQTDALVNHDLPALFTSLGIPVLTVDSVPHANEVDLSRSALDIVNNYHARMLSTAILAAQDPRMEYVQIVSFGCGHDAYLSDEIIRLMGEISGKTPLVLKLDESDVQGPLRIRVRSFVETLAMRREREKSRPVQELEDPYPVKFSRRDKKERLVLIPNVSHAFCRVMSAAMGKDGLRTVPLEVGREEAIRLGKQYVHNDICFPAQVVIGEALAALRSGKYDLDHVAVAMAKYVGDCRLTHYSALLRKALDDAGFAQVPIVTNDGEDSHDQHPGYRMSLAASMRIAFALPMIDVLEELLRKIRPYETVPGSANKAFEQAMDLLIGGLERQGIRGAEKGFRKAIQVMKGVEYDRSNPRPTVLIVGEYLLNFHPGANHDIEDYLEKNGFEIIEARMTDVIRKLYYNKDTQIKEYHVHKPMGEKAWYATADAIFEAAHAMTDRIAREHPLYERATRLPELVRASDPIIHHTFDAGEGVLIPGEILHHAAHGCRAFVILQPFGCLPNHVVGRGVAKKLKEMYPDAQILPLDYDPDVSFANLENRLQMLVMNVKGKEAQKRTPDVQEERDSSDMAKAM